jgi:hypothetical protein
VRKHCAGILTDPITRLELTGLEVSFQGLSRIEKKSSSHAFAAPEVFSAGSVVSGGLGEY